MHSGKQQAFDEDLNRVFEGIKKLSVYSPAVDSSKDTTNTSLPPQPTPTPSTQLIKTASLQDNTTVLSSHKNAKSKKIQSKSLYVQNFMRDLMNIMSKTMSIYTLGPEALIQWTESQYHASVITAVCTLAESDTYKNLVNFYRSEQYIDDNTPWEDLIKSPKSMYTKDKKQNLKRVDVLLRFADGVVVVLELKYVPLSYVRIPENAADMVKVLDEKFENTDSYAKVNSFYDYSLVYRVGNNNQQKSPVNSPSKYGSPSSSSSSSRSYSPNSKSTYDVEKAKADLIFKLAPTVDDIMKEYLKLFKPVVKNSSKRIGKKNDGGIQNAILKEYYHNGTKVKVGEVIKAGKIQALNYGKILRRANPEHTKDSVECYVLWGLWRNSFLELCKKEL